MIICLLLSCTETHVFSRSENLAKGLVVDVLDKGCERKGKKWSLAIGRSRSYIYKTFCKQTPRVVLSSFNYYEVPDFTLQHYSSEEWRVAVFTR